MQIREKNKEKSKKRDALRDDTLFGGTCPQP